LILRTAPWHGKRQYDKGAWAWQYNIVVCILTLKMKSWVCVVDCAYTYILMHYRCCK